MTVDKEETDALAVGVVATPDRPSATSSLRHEVGGTDLATLAGEADVSSGAIAMRLARARANLRLEFLLAFRRLELPTDRCRPVLLAPRRATAGARRSSTPTTTSATCPVCASWSIR